MVSEYLPRPLAPLKALNLKAAARAGLNRNKNCVGRGDQRGAVMNECAGIVQIDVGQST